MCIRDSEAFSDAIATSEVLERSGNTTTYYQVFDAPSLMSDRYWLNYTVYDNEFEGNNQHRHRAWSSVPDAELPDVRATLRGRHPDAMEIVQTHGSWEVFPVEGGHQLTFKTVADPGGAVPPKLAAILTGRRLPDNIRNMVQAAVDGT